MAPAEASSGDPSPAPRGVIGVPASRLQGSESDVEIQKISPRALTAWGGVDRGSAGGEYGVDRCSAGGEYGQFCGGSLKADPHRRWDVLFRDSATNSQEDRPGYMFLHLQSMWATIRDEEGDILVGRYLQKDEFPKAGHILLIDGYRLEVLEQSGTQNKAPVSVLSRPSRFGGRFWVLADQEEETDEELGEDDVLGEVSQCIPTTVEPLSPCTPSPSMAMLQERKVRRDPILVRKKMEASSRKPWSGPIPKVNRRPISLLDFFKPDWIKGSTNKSTAPSVLQPARSPVIAEGTSNSSELVSVSLRGSRDNFLNAAIKAVGHEVMASSVGFPMPKTGYKAQDLLRAQPQSDLDCRSLGYMAQEKPVRFDGSSPEVASGVGLALHPLSRGASPQKPRVSPNRGFPRLGAGRAVRVPPPSVAASLAMAGRGSKQPANGRPLGQVSGQGNPPVAKSSTPAQAGSSHTAAHAEVGETPPFRKKRERGKERCEPEEPNVSSSDEEEVGLTQEINLQIAGVLRHDPPLYVPEMIATLTQERESKQRDEVEQGHVPENAFIQQQSQSQQPVVQSTATKGGDVRIKREVVAIARLRATAERREIADQAKFDAAIAKLKEEEGKIKLATEKKKEELLARKHAAENKKKIPESPGRTLTEIDVVTDVVKEGPLSGDSPRHYNDRGVRSGISGGSKAIPGFPSRSGTARSIPALATMAARQGVPSALQVRLAGIAAVIALAWQLGSCSGCGGAREINQAKVVVGLIGSREEVPGEEPINGIVPSSHPKAILWKEPADLISGKEAGAEYAIMGGTILGRYGRKSPKRTGKMAPAHTKK
ncbi:hypothetical protein ZWY2020_053952 [Hordeum vulgare]|nr:hypothetical protein ZWY2020_053952 [Hordeum vulgare]